MITEYNKNCLICGRPSENIHHLCFGNALRRLSDEDGLTIPVCYPCHEEIHHNKVAMQMSRILGQMEYEKTHTREQFRKRYGVSYL